jgi:alkylation response protein AidB-like acyl-CoA dehydrogenase
MPELLPPALIALRERAERFAAEVLVPMQTVHAADELDRARARDQVTRAAREAGFFAMTQPQPVGGTEAGALAMTVVRDTFAGYNTGLDRHCFGPGPGVLAGCTEPLRSLYLLPMLAGEKRAGFAFTEPRDAAHYTRAVREADGTFLVHGRKSFVTRGCEADFLNTLVEVEGEGRVLLVIDAHAPGVRTERRFETLDGSHHAAFAFDAVRIPADRLIGIPGEGLPRALRQIGDTRLAIAARAVGLARWAIGFMHERLQPTPSSTGATKAREGARLRYAEMRILTFAARSMVYRTARLGESGADSFNEGIASKVYATEALGEVVDCAMQFAGGSALTVGHPLERLFREARVLRVAEGESDALRLSLARGSLDLGKGLL